MKPASKLPGTADKVLAARNFNQGFDTLEYVAAALLDLEYHTVEPGTEIKDVQAFEKELSSVMVY